VGTSIAGEFDLGGGIAGGTGGRPLLFALFPSKAAGPGLARPLLAATATEWLERIRNDAFGGLPVVNRKKRFATGPAIDP
jgi:hypothetical protein